MKLKELPLSIYQSCYLALQPKRSLMNKDKKCVDVVVSLTTIPSRVHSIHLVIRSLLKQTVRPTKIVLWVHKDLEKKLPNKLNKLRSAIFEIRPTEGHSSHRKLIHSLKAFPESPIVTCDDDLLYPKDWLEKLSVHAQKHPHKIIANQTRYIRYQENGAVKPYKQWTYPSTDKDPMAIIAIGAGGIWYPAKALNKQVNDTVLFMELAPRADDLWFKAMAILNKTPTITPTNKSRTPIPIIGSQRIALKKTNIGADKNRVQWQALVNYFNFKTH